MIEIDGLTKRYGDKTAVDRLSFVVEPGVVTGFLGPNGAGKSTTMRMIAGLDRPTTGTVRVNGKHYPGAAAPMSELGILLDARSVHPQIGAAAWRAHLPVYELTPTHASLEEAFMQVTQDSVEFHAGATR
jgi:ABC-2 type transport system ATP-binding protein